MIQRRFRLGHRITSTQRAFLDEHGFIVFAGVASADEIARLKGEIVAIERRWLAEGRTEVYGIPLFIGRTPGGERVVQRFPFTSCFSDYIHDFVRDPRFEPVRTMIGDGSRVGDREKDGVVVNRNTNDPGSVHAGVGWHTDGLRDLFYLRMPAPMLNVGLHLDRITAADGGLRVIPGSHRQSFAAMCFRKPYFVSQRPDPDELVIETEPGDLTVHDGRMWHRVQPAEAAGPRRVRHTMYVPYLTDAYQPKGESSPTPLYHWLGVAARWLQNAAVDRRRRASGD